MVPFESEVTHRITSNPSLQCSKVGWNITCPRVPFVHTRPRCCLYKERSSRRLERRARCCVSRKTPMNSNLRTSHSSARTVTINSALPVDKVSRPRLLGYINERNSQTTPLSSSGPSVRPRATPAFAFQSSRQEAGEDSLESHSRLLTIKKAFPLLLRRRMIVISGRRNWRKVRQGRWMARRELENFLSPGERDICPPGRMV